MRLSEHFGFGQFFLPVNSFIFTHTAYSSILYPFERAAKGTPRTIDFNNDVSQR